ncbi:MAG: hypothetical protein ONB12_12595, partial [candidate division KSB1 bacterium]|nr:hypothetical protein [candidate division KSB1 bacterium]
PVTINLSAVKGTLDMQWMNPKTNEHSSITKVNGGGSVTLTPPFTGEWVLHIGTIRDTIPPAPPTGLVVNKP